MLRAPVKQKEKGGMESKADSAGAFIFAQLIKVAYCKLKMKIEMDEITEGIQVNEEVKTLMQQELESRGKREKEREALTHDSLADMVSATGSFPNALEESAIIYP